MPKITIEIECVILEVGEFEALEARAQEAARQEAHIGL